MKEVAVLSDIHGNRWALEAVLADIDRRGVADMVNLGDSLFGPLDPEGTADILMRLGLPTVRGNEDRVVVDGSSAAESPTLRFTRESLRKEHFDWLENIEPTAVAFDSLFMCHGSPDHDTEYLLHVVREVGATRATKAELTNKLAGISQSVVLCGHDHVPRKVRLPNQKLIVNPGSVGLPAYCDHSPYPHTMQAGTPHARYSILYGNHGGWRVEEVAVPYDWHMASSEALRNGRPDWACWLQTGRAG